MLPKDVHILIPETCDYVTSHASVINQGSWAGKMMRGYPDGWDTNPKTESRDVTVKAKVQVMHIEEKGTVPQLHQQILGLSPRETTKAPRCNVISVQTDCRGHWPSPQRRKKSWIPGEGWWGAARIKRTAVGKEDLARVSQLVIKKEKSAEMMLQWEFQKEKKRMI